MNLSTIIAVTKALLGVAKHIQPKKHLPVLVVEDDAADAHLIQMALKKIGVESVWVESLAAARAIIQDGKFHMVILDIQFPTGNGLKFSDDLYVDFPNLPVLFLTGHLPEIKIGPDVVRVLGPGRVWTMSPKGVESGSLEQALRVALKMSNGVNGHMKASELVLATWLLLFLTAALAFGLGFVYAGQLIKP
jgi:DNA-binding response OmpR family regulator